MISSCQEKSFGWTDTIGLNHSLYRRETSAFSPNLRVGTRMGASPAKGGATPSRFYQQMKQIKQMFITTQNLNPNNKLGEIDAFFLTFSNPPLCGNKGGDGAAFLTSQRLILITRMPIRSQCFK